MTSRAFFHYILAFTVLCASSFAVFHGSEHIAIGETDSAKVSLTKDKLGYFESEHQHHDLEEPDSTGTSHSLESLCEACLLVSNLSACGFAYACLRFSPDKDLHRRFKSIYAERQAFQTYLSRAPPGQA